LVKLADITKLGWPVAQPRFIRRPSARIRIERPFGSTNSSNCGLMLMRFMPSTFLRPAMSISLSKWPMFADDRLVLHLLMCSTVMIIRVARGGDEDVGGRTTSSSVVT
jgi:hypothetical protein